MHVRRLGIIAALAVFALGLAPSGAPAQTFTKPVRIIVPFAPGGTSDILARLIGPKLQDAIGQPVVSRTRPAPAAISAPTWSPRPRRMATPCC